MTKRRRFDEQVVTDTDISDFLDTKPVLYKHIQLSCFLEKLPEITEIDNSSPERLCTSVLDNIKKIINRFFPKVELKGDTGNYNIVTSNDNLSFISKNIYFERYNTKKFIAVNFLVYDFDADDDDFSRFFQIPGESFDKYFDFLSKKISEQYSLNMRIFIDERMDYAITATIFDN